MKPNNHQRATTTQHNSVSLSSSDETDTAHHTNLFKNDNANTSFPDNRSCSGLPSAESASNEGPGGQTGYPKPVDYYDPSKMNDSVLCSMEQFQRLLVPNKNVIQSEGRISIGKKQYYYLNSLYYPDCNGAYCVEDRYEFISKSKKDTLELVYWHGLGFFCDVNNDKNIDWIYIDYGNTEPMGHNHIYKAETFEVLVKTLDKKTFQFVDLKDDSGLNYSIKIFWSGMWDETKDKIRILEQHWPYAVKSYCN
ncbi:MAG: hypothetical protein QE487_14290 [Fluviicola sp.]|nr:hypothetical protein [Fluviicola sp.]